MYRSSADDSKYDYFGNWYRSGESSGYRGDKEFRIWTDRNGRKDIDPDPEEISDKDTASNRTDQPEDDEEKTTEKEVEHAYKNDVNDRSKTSKNASITEKSSPISGNSKEVRSETLSDDKSQRRTSHTPANLPSSNDDKKATTSDNVAKDRKSGSDNISKNLFHRKCNVVKLVRNQMETLHQRITEDVRLCTRCKPAGASNGWQKKFAILVGLLPFLLWITAIFGALAGSHLCGGKSMRIAWMALKMIDTCVRHQTHHGQPTRMRIGLHTASVLAGVVRDKMPRYCMFGHNVTIANKFESGSEPLRIDISPTTYSHLVEHPGFSFEEGGREFLPKDFLSYIPSSCYFLTGYKHPDLPDNSTLDEFVDVARKDVGLFDC